MASFAISGNPNISSLAVDPAHAALATHAAQVDAQAAVAELRDTLFNIEAVDPKDAEKVEAAIVHTPTDRFVNDNVEIAKAKKAAKMGSQGSKNTRPGKVPEGTATGEVTDLVAEGILSAEAILSQSVISPTGTQTVCALEINAATLALFNNLRELHLSADHHKLAMFVPQLQASFGPRNLWSSAAQFAGYYGILDPMLLSPYVPFCESLQDLNDEQVTECFHPFQEVDSFPVVNGVPVWERQEWERIEYYNAFKLYRDMRYAFYNEADMLLTNRSFTTLSKAIRVPAGLLSYLARVYQWQLRCNLYDEWMAKQQQMRQAIKRSLLLDRHAKVSQALVQKAYLALSKNVDKMSPKDALAMLELGLKYERLSTGLPGDKLEGTGGGSTSGAGPSISIVNQTNSGNGALQVNAGTATQQQLQENMKRPDTLLSVLAVLQRSNAFNTLLASQEQEAKEADAEAIEVLDVTPVEGAPTEEVGKDAPSAVPTGAPGFVFNDVPRDPADDPLRGFADG